MKNNQPIMNGNPEYEIKEPPIIKSIELYLEKLELLNEKERNMFPEIFKSLSLSTYIIMK